MPQLYPQPAHPAAVAADLGAVELGSGGLDGLDGRVGDRQDALSAQGLQRLLVGLDHAERGQHAGQQDGDQRAVAGGGGVELVGPEEQRGRGGELGAEHRAERDGASALLDDRDGLARGQAARPRAGHLLQRRRDRLEGAQVGAGADHHGDAGLMQAAHALLQVPDRGGGRDDVGDVVGADQDQRDVGLDRQGPVDLLVEVGGLGADHGEVAQVDAAVGVLGHAAGQQRPGGLLDTLDAVAGRTGVAEQGHLDRGAGSAAAVPAGRVGRGLLEDRPDGLAGQLGLGRQDTVETCAQHGEPAAAVGRGGRELACCCCLPHTASVVTAGGPSGPPRRRRPSRGGRHVWSRRPRPS